MCSVVVPGPVACGENGDIEAEEGEPYSAYDTGTTPPPTTEYDAPSGPGSVRHLTPHHHRTPPHVNA